MIGSCQFLHIRSPIVCSCFLFFSASSGASSNSLDIRELYISESISRSGGTPKLNFEKNSNLKWFEESATLLSGGRSEIGVRNLVSGYTLSYRNQSLHGTHNGRGAKFECLLAFCAWIDSSIVSGLEKSERIYYRINMQQLWIEKVFENVNYSVGLIAGINVIGIDFNISSSMQSYRRSDEVPVPFLGLSSKYKLKDDLYLALNIHHFEAQKNNLKFEFHDSEIEFNFNLAKHIKLSVGNNIVYLNIRNKTKETNSEIYVPKNSPYIKITFIY
jgi:hypothetical protein